MTFRERCACGAEFETGGETDEQSSDALGLLIGWRERHAKVCKAVEHTVDTCKDEACAKHWYPNLALRTVGSQT